MAATLLTTISHPCGSVTSVTCFSLHQKTATRRRNTAAPPVYPGWNR